ncbi:MAG: hypothetical protein JOZ93_15275 [Sinobacteraceae bacterium]|nr:hypothetical protein [Nevskiaceae bacterium]
MTTPLNKTLRREVIVKGQSYIVSLSVDGLKMTLKGHRKGVQLSWEALVSGDAALAVALNASMGQLTAAPAAAGKARKRIVSHNRQPAHQ